LVPGIDLQRSLELLHRALEIPEFRQDDSEIIVQVCVAPIELYQFAIAVAAIS
jgi:hypothetical protein